MKKFIAWLIALLMVLSVSACTPAKEGDGGAAREEITLNVFAAASMTETMDRISSMYAKALPGASVVLSLDSSGTLKTQIEEGAECDVFISAADKQMDELQKLGLIDAATRMELLENACVLVVPEGNPADIAGFEDLASDRLSLIAVGNADVPAGRYSEEMLRHMGLWDALERQGKLSFASNVKEVVSQVSEGAVDCGIVYATDAAAAELKVAAEAPAGSHSRIVYPAAVIANSSHPEAAKAFLDYLASEECAAIFAEAGFLKADQAY